MEGVSNVSKCLCWRISQCLVFSYDIMALPEARTDTEPAGEIRGGLHEKLCHSDVIPKMTYKTGTAPHNF